MRHRHLEVAPATPAAELGLAALDDLLDRGDLSDWTPLLQEIRRAPYGGVADRVLNLVAHHPMVGTSALWRSWILEQRAEQAAAEDTFHAGSALREWRALRGLTQAQLAVRLNTTQSEISKLERRGDVKLSTLRAYVAALGGTVELEAHFGVNELDPS